ncbi:MAG TPA: hypothetical protein EYG80_00880 [Flavobacteriaceae bacterium]|nr:hypothetical protein [Flavobacteriaceae bacterium]
MTSQNQPILNKMQLVKSVIIALLISGIVFITAVLPAEFGIDPLGTGKLFGFERLYQEDKPITKGENKKETSILNFKKLKMEKLGSPKDVAKPIEANNPTPKEQYPQREDTIKVIVPAKKGIEYKFKSLKHASIKYEWSTDKGIVYIDFHGEVKQENPSKNVFYESYTLAYSNNKAGTLTTPFEGKHGWYFRNETNEEIIVTLKLKGQYQVFQ